jgi:hypothetical protein
VAIAPPDPHSALGQALHAVLGCVHDALREPVGRVVVMPGASVVWDDCCEGQLWVRVVSVVGAGTLTKSAMQPCAPLYQVNLTVGVVRCAAVIDSQGNPPTPAVMTHDADTTLRDFADVVTGLVCCASKVPEISALRVESWAPVGVDGGCVGGEVSASFRMALCSPCDA